jgi:hypothetical protein
MGSTVVMKYLISQSSSAYEGESGRDVDGGGYQPQLVRAPESCKSWGWVCLDGGPVRLGASPTKS